MANYKTLTYGTTGEDVKKLQQSLNAQGADLDTDGIYGEKTRSAVRGYQQSNGLMVDGIAGSETLGHLYGTGLADTQDTQATTSLVSGTGLDPAVATIPRIVGTPGATQAVTPQVSTQRTPEQAWQDYLNREVFSYDPEKDPLYQSYRKQYTDAGRLAMEDTVGMASTLTGGYGNSYAQTAGQQTYNAYLQQLAGVMPELYGAAYDRYRAEGEALYNEIVLTEQRRENAYNKLVSLMSLGYDPTDEELTAAGLTRSQANTIRNHYTSTYTPTYTSTYTAGNIGYDSGSCSEAEIMAMQRALGVTVDGLWGERSKAAAKERWGTTDPDAAWRANNRELEMQYKAAHLTGYNAAKEVLAYYGIGNAIHKVMTQETWEKKRNAYLKNNAYGGQDEITEYGTYQAYLNDYVAYLLNSYGK